MTGPALPFPVRDVLAPGLTFVAWRDCSGQLVIVLSDSLNHQQSRQAVDMAMAAARRHGWKTGPLPAAGVVPAAALGVRLLHSASVRASAVMGMSALVIAPVIWHTHLLPAMLHPGSKPAPSAVLTSPVKVRSGRHRKPGPPDKPQTEADPVADQATPLPAQAPAPLVQVSASPAPAPSVQVSAGTKPLHVGDLVTVPGLQVQVQVPVQKVPVVNQLAQIQLCLNPQLAKVCAAA